MTCLGGGPSADCAFAADSLRVRENEDNSAVIRAARDALRLIQNKLLPAACSWVQVWPWVRAGPRVRAGPWVWVGSWVWVFFWVWACSWIRAGSWVPAGSWVRADPWPGCALWSGQALGPDGLHVRTEDAGLALGESECPA